MNGGPNGELPESENLEEELKKRANLYQKYAHSVLPFVPGEGIKESANRLHAHILKILQ